MTTIPREEIDALRAQARADLPLRQRFEMQIRFARELGWIQVRDPFTGEWLEIWGKDAPSGWVRAAFAEKQRRQRHIEQRAASATSSSAPPVFRAKQLKRRSRSDDPAVC